MEVDFVGGVAGLLPAGFALRMQVVLLDLIGFVALVVGLKLDGLVAPGEWDLAVTDSVAVLLIVVWLSCCCC